MLRTRDWYLGQVGRLSLAPDDEGGGSEGGGASGEGGNAGAGSAGGSGNADPLAGLTDEQQKAIQKRIDAAASAARKDGKTAAEQVIADAKRKADEDAQRQKDIDAGEYEKVKTDFESRVTTAEQRATAAEDELNAIWDDRITRMTAEMKTFSKDLPDWTYYPGDDATPKARWAWFEKAGPNAKKQDADAQGRPRTGGMTPKPNGNDSDTQPDEQTRRQIAARYQ